MDNLKDESNKDDWATPHVKKAIRVEAWITGVVTVVIVVILTFGAIAK